jgi:hypothetical protein
MKKNLFRLFVVVAAPPLVPAVSGRVPTSGFRVSANFLSGASTDPSGLFGLPDHPDFFFRVDAVRVRNPDDRLEGAAGRLPAAQAASRFDSGVYFSKLFSARKTDFSRNFNRL